MSKKKQHLIAGILLVAMIGILFGMSSVWADRKLQIGDYMTFGEENGELITWRVADTDVYGGVVLLPNDAVKNSINFNTSTFERMAAISELESNVLCDLVEESTSKYNSGLYLISVNDMEGVEAKLNAKQPYDSIEMSDGSDGTVSGTLPAIFIDEAGISGLSGDGTEESPYIDGTITGLNTTTEVTIAVSECVVGDTIEAVAVARTHSGKIVNNGKIQFYANGEKIGKAVSVDESGEVTANFDLEIEGVNVITAKYLGVVGFFASTEDYEMTTLVSVSNVIIDPVPDPETPVTEPEEETTGDETTEPLDEEEPITEDTDFSDMLLLGIGQTITIGRASQNGGYAIATKSDKYHSPMRTGNAYWNGAKYVLGTMGLYWNNNNNTAAYCMDLDVPGPQFNTTYTITGLANWQVYRAVRIGMDENINIEAVARAVHILTGDNPWSQFSGKDKSYAQPNVGLSDGQALANKVGSYNSYPENGQAGTSAAISMSVTQTLAYSGGNIVGEISVTYTSGTAPTFSPSGYVTPTGSATNSGGKTTQRYTVNLPTSYSGSTFGLSASITRSGQVVTVYQAVSGGLQPMAIVDISSGSSSKSASVTMNVPQLGSLTLNKMDSFTGQKMPGCTFKVYRSDGVGVVANGSNGSYTYSGNGTATTLSTNASGTLVLSALPLGNYYVEEVAAPDTHNKDTSTKPFTSTSGGNATVTMTNVPKVGELKLIKKDSYTGENLAGCTFKLYNETLNTGIVVSGGNGAYSATGVGTATEMETDPNGELTVSNLPAGKYYISEISAPDEYNLSSYASFVLGINGTGDVVNATVTMENRPKSGSLTLVKKDAFSGENITGCTFSIFRKEDDSIVAVTGSAGEYVAMSNSIETVLTTNSGGVMSVTGLLLGDYYIKEISAPALYSMDVDKDFTIENNSIISVTMNNIPKKASVTLTKKDSFTGENMAGCTFKLFREDDTGIVVSGSAGVYSATGIGTATEMSTSSGGVLTVSDLPVGNYYFQEVSVPSTYYKAADKPFVINLNGDVAVNMNVTVENAPKTAKMTLTKKDALTQEFLAGCTFSIYRVSDNAGVIASGSNGVYTATGLGEATILSTSAGGILEVSGLKVDDYYVKEIYAPDAYIKDDDKTFSIIINGSGDAVDSVVAMNNTPKTGTLTLYKRDAVTGALMDGCTFTIHATPSGPALKVSGGSGVYTYDVSNITGCVAPGSLMAGMGSSLSVLATKIASTVSSGNVIIAQALMKIDFLSA